MKKEKVIYDLIIANLALIFLLLLKKITILKEFINVLIVVIITPILFGVFLFYILRPMNKLFLRKGMKKSYAATLTLIIVIFILSAIVKYFSNYLLVQIFQLRDMFEFVIENQDLSEYVNNYIEVDTIQGVIGNYLNKLVGNIGVIFYNIKDIFNTGMMIFSDFLLVILIVFFLLKDGEKVKSYILKWVPLKYKEFSEKVISKSDDILSTYVVGQATVALSLATMVFIGYKIIGMPSGIVLASMTFILAFIPFIGFFISMIIPYIIAIVVGIEMVVKLSILVLIAQTLKGRVVVPFIMGKAMKIHPITDIFLVVGAAAIGGPLMAFCIVPIYSILKMILINMKNNKMISFFGNIDNKKKV